MNFSALLFCLCVSTAPTAPDRWLAEDKLKHFFASFAATSLTAGVAHAAGADVRSSAWIGAGVGAGIGVTKELLDQGRRGETASYKDLTWDLAGVAGATVLMRQVR